MTNHRLATSTERTAHASNPAVETQHLAAPGQGDQDKETLILHKMQFYDLSARGRRSRKADPRWSSAIPHPQ
jgi:hypothetical protein